MSTGLKARWGFDQQPHSAPSPVRHRSDSPVRQASPPPQGPASPESPMSRMEQQPKKKERGKADPAFAEDKLWVTFAKHISRARWDTANKQGYLFNDGNQLVMLKEW